MESDIIQKLHAALKAVSQRATKSHVRGFGGGSWQGWWWEQYIFCWNSFCILPYSFHQFCLPKKYTARVKYVRLSPYPIPSTGNELSLPKSWMNNTLSQKNVYSSPYKRKGHEQAISRSRHGLFIAIKPWDLWYDQIHFINEIMEAGKHEKFSYFSAGYSHAFSICHNLIYFMFSWLFIVKIR